MEVDHPLIFNLLTVFLVQCIIFHIRGERTWLDIPLVLWNRAEHRMVLAHRHHHHLQLRMGFTRTDPTLIEPYDEELCNMTVYSQLENLAEHDFAKELLPQIREELLLIDVPAHLY